MEKKQSSISVSKETKEQLKLAKLELTKAGLLDIDASYEKLFLEMIKICLKK